jgi:hypothetical protein
MARGIADDRIKELEAGKMKLDKLLLTLRAQIDQARKTNLTEDWSQVRATSGDVLGQLDKPQNKTTYITNNDLEKLTKKNEITAPDNTSIRVI